MKYFTPELIARYGSDDPAIYKAAEAEWDARCETYNDYLASMKSALPAGARLIQENYLLHDALICGMGRSHHAFVIVLRLDAPPGNLLTLAYELQSPAIILDLGKSTDAPPDTHVEWQYDELEGSAEAPSSWMQSILLSNGWEVRLQFRDIQVIETQAILPAPRCKAPPVFGQGISVLNGGLEHLGEHNVFPIVPQGKSISEMMSEAP